MLRRSAGVLVAGMLAVCVVPAGAFRAPGLGLAARAAARARVVGLGARPASRALQPRAALPAGLRMSSATAGSAAAADASADSKPAVRKRILSGVQPTGNLHLGNYLGAIRQWVANQDEYENYFCVVDLHAITAPHVPAELTKSSFDIAALYLAAGIDPAKSKVRAERGPAPPNKRTAERRGAAGGAHAGDAALSAARSPRAAIVQVFIQSHVTAHAELCWLLNCESCLPCTAPVLALTPTACGRHRLWAYASRTRGCMPAHTMHAPCVHGSQTLHVSFKVSDGDVMCMCTCVIVRVGVTPMGWMEKMIQYKEKAKKQVHRRVRSHPHSLCVYACVHACIEYLHAITCV